MDIFDTSVLNQVVENLDRPQSFLLDAFFRQEQRSTSEYIEFHVKDEAARLAPFVSPLKAGKAIANEGYTAKNFKPAYVKDKRQFNPRDALVRMVGERIGGELSPAERQNRNVALALANQLDTLTRREEWMAAQVLRNGSITVVGEGYPSVVVNFGRHADLTQTLLTTARWGESGVSPMDNLETWFDTVTTRGGGAVTHVVLAPGAWKLLRADAKFQNNLDREKGQDGSVQYFLNPTGTGGNWARYQGRIGNIEFWVYNQPYIADDGSAATMLNDMDVLLLNMPGLLGTRAYGMIHDEEANFAATRYFSKSWLEKDPSVRWLLLQSAPLMVPYRPNASMRVQVR
jgi:hypothetical protein